VSGEVYVGKSLFVIFESCSSGNMLYLGQGPIADRCLLIAKEWSIRGRLKLCRMSNESAIMETINRFHVGTLISVHNPLILSNEVIDAVNGNAFNLHNAALPKYKGFNSIGLAILNGDEEYTTTIHWVVPEVDCGDIAYEERILIKRDDSAQSLYWRTVEAAAVNFNKFLYGWVEDTIPKKQQIGKGCFYKRHDLDQYREIQNIHDFQEIDVKARAFYIPPYEPAYFLLEGKKFYVIGGCGERKF